MSAAFGAARADCTMPKACTYAALRGNGRPFAGGENIFEAMSSIDISHRRARLYVAVGLIAAFALIVFGGVTPAVPGGMCLFHIAAILSSERRMPPTRVEEFAIVAVLGAPVLAVVAAALVWLIHRRRTARWTPSGGRPQGPARETREVSSERAGGARSVATTARHDRRGEAAKRKAALLRAIYGIAPPVGRFPGL